MRNKQKLIFSFRPLQISHTLTQPSLFQPVITYLPQLSLEDLANHHLAIKPPNRVDDVVIVLIQLYNTTITVAATVATTTTTTNSTSTTTPDTTSSTLPSDDFSTMTLPTSDTLTISVCLLTLPSFLCTFF